MLLVRALLKVAIAFGPVAILVGGQFRIADAKSRCRRVVGVCIQLAVEFLRANLRGILVSRSTGYECLIRNAQSIMERIGRYFPHSKRILANQRLYLKSDILHDNRAGHGSCSHS
jgi:hypothetical protein